MGYETPIVSPPNDYNGDFFKGKLKKKKNKGQVSLYLIFFENDFRYCRWTCWCRINHSKRGYAWHVNHGQGIQRYVQIPKSYFRNASESPEFVVQIFHGYLKFYY